MLADAIEVVMEHILNMWPSTPLTTNRMQMVLGHK